MMSKKEEKKVKGGVEANIRKACWVLRYDVSGVRTLDVNER